MIGKDEAHHMAILEPHGVEFPALSEAGIDGKTVAIDPQDIIPVF